MRSTEPKSMSSGSVTLPSLPINQSHGLPHAPSVSVVQASVNCVNSLARYVASLVSNSMSEVSDEANQ